MEILETQQGSIIHLTLIGRLDTITSKSLEEKVLSLIEANGLQMIVDCQQLAYVSSPGLRVLLMAAKKLKPLNGKLVLVFLQPHIKEIFEIAGFLAMFQIFDTKDEAVKSLG